MHAVNQITSQVLMIMAIGVILWLVIMKLIFRKKK
jgi:hypothetical protein